MGGSEISIFELTISCSKIVASLFWETIYDILIPKFLIFHHMKINDIPSSIPKSREKERLLTENGTPHLYLGQGLMFVPPAGAKTAYDTFLREYDCDPACFPLDVVQAKGEGGDVYNSPRLDAVWADIQRQQLVRGLRSPEAFGTFIREQSHDTMRQLFQVDPECLATMQVDNLMQALRSVQEIIAKLVGQHVSRVILPKQYKYSGHTDFTANAKAIGIDMEVVEVPEVQIDGSQDLSGLEQAFERIKQEERIAIFIDQEHNNNASGFDRDEKYNADLSTLLKKYAGVVFYFGDDAYKGLKEDILDPYSLMQQLITDGVSAFHYTSFSKTGNYRGTPSFKNILTATSGNFADTKVFQGAFEKIQRPEGIGATADGAILMHRLVFDPAFLQEVRTLHRYLYYVRTRLKEGLAGTKLAELFSEKTHGIFRCMPPDVTQQLNSGREQVVTVGDRINIWPLGDPASRDFFIKLLQN